MHPIDPPSVLSVAGFHTPRRPSLRVLGSLVAATFLQVGCSSGTGPGQDLAAPIELRAVLVSDTVVDLVWSHAGSADGFEIQRAEDVSGVPAAFAVVGEVAGVGASFQDCGTTEGSTYWYRVSASQGGQTSGFSDLLAVTTGTTSTLPAAPEAVQAVALSSDEVLLSWQDSSSGEEGFLVERARGSEAFKSLTQVGAATESLVDFGLVPEESYRYRVRAFAGTRASPYSDVVQVTLAPQPSVSGLIEEVDMGVYTQWQPRLLVEPDGRSFLQVHFWETVTAPWKTLLVARNASGGVTWQREFPVQVEFARASDGNLWMLRDDPLTGLGAAKVDANDGSILWQNTYRTGGTWVHRGDDPLATLLIDGSDEGAVVGEVGGDGRVMWSMLAWLEASDLPLSSGGRLILGARNDTANNTVARIDASGVTQWQTWFLGPNFDDELELVHVFECNDGGIGLLGALNVFHAWIAKLDSSGNLVSQKTLTGPGLSVGSSLQVRVGADEAGGRFVLANDQASDPWILRLEADGGLSWSREIRAPGRQTVAFVVPRLVGGCYLVGTTDTTMLGGRKDAWVAALDVTGDVEWEQVLDAGEEERIWQASVTRDGGLFLGGASVRTEKSAVWSAKVGAAGQLQSQALWADPRADVHPGEIRSRPGGGWAFLIHMSDPQVFRLGVIEIDADGFIERSSVVDSDAGGSIAFDSGDRLHVSYASRHLVLDPPSARDSGDVCIEPLVHVADGVLLSGGSASSSDPSSEDSLAVFTLPSATLVPGVIDGEATFLSPAPGAARISTACTP